MNHSKPPVLIKDIPTLKTYQLPILLLGETESTHHGEIRLELRKKIYWDVRYKITLPAGTIPHPKLKIPTEDLKTESMLDYPKNANSALLLLLEYNGVFEIIHPFTEKTHGNDNFMYEAHQGVIPNLDPAVAEKLKDKLFAFWAKTLEKIKPQKNI